MNPKGPLPRNSRTWQVWIDEFVHNFIASNESNDLDLVVSFYAPTVDLFEEGKNRLTPSAVTWRHTTRTGPGVGIRSAVT